MVEQETRPLQQQVPGVPLGGTAGAAAFDHFLHLLHEGRAVGALERVFPSLAPEGPTALATRAAPTTLQAGQLLGGLAGGIALLLLVVIPDPLPLTGDFSVTAVARIPAATFAVRLPQAREPAFSMFAFDGLAGVKHILFLITEDTAMAFQALTTVGESIDGQAGAMHTLISKARVIGALVAEGPSPAFLTHTGGA